MRVPQVRFKGFSDEWTKEKFEEFAKVLMNKRIFKHQTSEKGDIPFFKIGTFGGVADAFISKDLFEEYKDKYPYPQKGDILLSASGSIGRIVEYSGKDEYFQDSNIVWLEHKQMLDNNFLQYFYAIVNWYGLEGSTIKRLYNKNILATEITYPNKTEQTKIGNFFKNIDKAIALEEQKYTKLMQMKKALLEKMFPKEGAQVPEIRFHGFSGEWEEKKFKSFFDGFIPSNTLSRADLTSEKREFQNIHYGDILVKFGTVLDVKKQFIPFIEYPRVINFKNNTLKNGDIIFADAAEDETVGKAVEVLGIANEKILSGLHTIACRPYKTVKNGFLGYYINSNSYRKQLFKLMQGTKVLSISKTSLTKTSLQIPAQGKEQTKIGNLFKTLDKRLTLQQAKIAKLQNVKKALLEKMFV